METGNGETGPRRFFVTRPKVVFYFVENIRQGLPGLSQSSINLGIYLKQSKLTMSGLNVALVLFWFAYMRYVSIYFNMIYIGIYLCGS